MINIMSIVKGKDADYYVFGINNIKVNTDSPKTSIFPFQIYEKQEL